MHPMLLNELAGPREALATFLATLVNDHRLTAHQITLLLAHELTDWAAAFQEISGKGN